MLQEYDFLGSTLFASLKSDYQYVKLDYPQKQVYNFFLTGLHNGRRYTIRMHLSITQNVAMLPAKSDLLLYVFNCIEEGSFKQEQLKSIRDLSAFKETPGLVVGDNCDLFE